MYKIVQVGEFALWADGVEYVVTQNDIEVLRTMNKVRAEREMRHMLATQ